MAALNPALRTSDVRALLARLDVQPNRLLGQNFLIDANILRILLEAADLSPADGVLEIGPGLGALTAPLLERAGRVVAIEKDAALFAHLQATFGHHPHLTLIHADALDCDLAGLVANGLNKVVANLPYAIGTRALVELCGAPVKPTRFAVTVQREVAERLKARPGSRDYGALSVLVQLHYAVELRKRVAPSCFYPAPSVESAIVVLLRLEGGPQPTDEQRFRSLVKECFEHRRKQMGTLVRRPEALARAGIEAKRRPETLSVEEWVRLADLLE
ncbi:MAG: 16S rRNA (adenine(1518)-N(6)/adenine(1519)-N(6))-dimethyltransferase RsmA [Kiritimatiellae bacterium]|nr:16S rRNA (adenine(1518)-N(6)/adenine(1519)-N(6))-dimethyltransferase RsmA [Kiritimatiellia bacterium]MDW8459035.1 16S rRNA (adenine(1518)-N(6)/adenine(1519)-N(6))-dimethyltransferase RsmA [Verrucomicrobiota bacterium]